MPSGLSRCQKPPLRSITMTLRRVSPDALTLVINIQDVPTVMLMVGFCAVANIWYAIEQETLRDSVHTANMPVLWVGVQSRPYIRITKQRIQDERSDEMSALLDRITIDPAINHGKPVIRGLRYPLETLLELLSADMSVDDILADYEDLEREDVLAAIAFADSLE